MVHEGTVVADDDDGLSGFDEEIFEPLDRLDVEVIRRLVEEQNVGFLEQQLRQLDAHPPSTAKLAGLPSEVGALETQAHQRLLDIGMIVNIFNGIEFLAQRRDTLDKLHVIVGIIVGPRLQLPVQFVYLRLHLVQVGESLLRLLEDSPPVVHHQVLGQISDNGILRSRDFPACRLADAGQDFEEGRFPRAVLSHQGYPVFFVNDKGNI